MVFACECNIWQYEKLLLLFLLSRFHFVEFEGGEMIAEEIGSFPFYLGNENNLLDGKFSSWKWKITWCGSTSITCVGRCPRLPQFGGIAFE